MKKIFIFLVLASLIIALGAVGVFAGKTLITKFTPSKAPSKAPTKSDAEKKAERAEKQKALLELIKEIFKTDSSGTSISVGIYDLKRKEYFSYNDTSPQHAASVSKILTAIVLLDKIEKGEINLSDRMGAYNVEFQLEKMVNISNQDSWDLIDAKLGFKVQEDFAREKLNLTSVDLDTNVMSVKDTVELLRQLAEGKILTESSRERLFSYMQNTESEDFFSPAFKKSGVTFYHKTGKFEGEGHDAAIVKGKNPFILVIFSVNNTNPNLIGRGAPMTKAASAVLNYFNEID